MKVTPVIERIKAADLGFKLVDGVLAIANLTNAPGALPACYVVQAANSYVSEQEGAGLIVIGDDSLFDVIIVVSSSAQHGRDGDELEAFADAVIAVLLGWTPDADLIRPIVPVAGRLSGVGGGRASWTVRFRTYSRLRKQG